MTHKLRAFVTYLENNRAFLGRVLKQYAANTVNVRILARTRVVEPLAAVFYATHRCNLACRYCTQMSPHVLSQELSTEKTVVLLRIVRPQVGSLYVTGGEPLLRHDLEEVLRAAAAMGFWTILHTNALLLDRREKVLDSIQSLMTSLDSMDEARSDSIAQAPPGTARHMISNIALYGRAMRASGRPMGVNCVIDRRNLDDVYDVMEFCREHDFVFSCCPALQNGLTPYDLLDDERYHRLADHILESKRRRRLKINGSAEELEFILKFKDFNCYPTLFARIYPNGDVYYPCVPLKTIGGNLFQTPAVKEIYRRARAEHGDIPRCGGRCHLYSNITSHFYVHRFWNLAREYK